MVQMYIDAAVDPNACAPDRELCRRVRSFDAAAVDFGAISKRRAPVASPESDLALEAILVLAVVVKCGKPDRRARLVASEAEERCVNELWLHPLTASADNHDLR